MAKFKEGTRVKTALDLEPPIDPEWGWGGGVIVTSVEVQKASV